MAAFAIYTLFHRVPFAFLAGAWAAGVLAAERGLLAPPPGQALGASAVLVAVALAAFFMGAGRRFAAAALLAACMVLGAASAARVLDAISAHPPRALAVSDNLLDGRLLSLQGRLTSAPSFGPWAAQFDMEVESMRDGGVLYRNLRGGIRVRVPGSPRTAQRFLTAANGDRVRVKASLSLPSDYANEGGFSYAAYLRRRGIGLRAAAEKPWSVRVLQRAEGWRGFFNERRRAVRESIAEHFPGERGALTDGRGGILLALATGDRGSLEPDDVRRFQDTGIFHVLAISGLHVGILAFGVFFLLRPLAGLRPAAAGALAATLFFALLVNPAASVWRAALMTLLYFGGYFLRRRPEPVNLVCAAAFMLLAFRPLDIFEPGFQLTFAATLGIAVIACPLSTLLPRMPFHMEFLFACSAAAQLCTLPVMLQSFQRVSTAGLLLNMWIVPMTDILLKAEALFLILARWNETAARWAALLCRSVLDAMLVPTAWVHEHMGWAELRPCPAPAWQVALYVAALAALALALSLGKGRRPAAFAVAAALALLLAPSRPSRAAGEGLDLGMLDVGQGLCAVLEFPAPEGGRRPVMLVDAGGAPGGRFDMGENVVAPWLRRRGIRRIDWLAVTADRADHAAGARRLLEDFRVDELWLPWGAERKHLTPLMEAAKSRGISVRFKREGDALLAAGAEIKVLAPLADGFSGGGRKPEDPFMVLSLQYGGRSLLIPSDITERTERELVKRMGADLRHDFMLMPRHGAAGASSPAFLDAAAPRLALLSVGRNPWKWPSEKALARYGERGIRVLRTDRDGMIRLHLSPEGWRMDWRGE